MIAVLCLLLPLAVVHPVKQSADASPDGAIVLENTCGTVSVTGWDKPQIEINGELDQDSDEVRVTGSPSRVQVKVRNKGPDRVRCAALRVQVPASARLEIETVSADLEVIGVRGALDLDTVSGDVSVKGSPAEAAIETVSGNVLVEADTRSLDVETVSGDISALRVSGRVEMRTVSGEVSVEGGPFEKVDIGSVSGDLSLSGPLDPQARVELGAHSGNVTLTLPKNLPATWSLSTFSGDIQGLPESKEKREVMFAEGAGTASLKVVTHSGSIELKGR